MIKAIHLKSFDYRVLNLLLYQLRGEQVAFLYDICLCHMCSGFLLQMSIEVISFSKKKKSILNIIQSYSSIFTLVLFSCTFFEAIVKVNEVHMDFLSISEFLVEVADDL